ncbi:pirin family protein [Sandaracinobacteroides saxicola]|uniref:Pirin family protein n=1 Tax=Sandaracinobacteroides saxicola TaxID=2759707 RepID=A0A7G5IGV8_9SPHN|nr:pirin family protein [Sandaracinobacteroides saxicola]QMW22600.1 pirin family protein [Sandaracinobacteroides saxicola]
MMTLRKAADRGVADFGWLDSRHSFSFGHYHDPAHMGFGPLRVINEDRVAGGGGFPPHGHADMEILSYVIDGALEHRDSMGNGAVIRPGEIQKMRAGTGVQHSEYNASKTDPVHFLQIWIIPAHRGLAPGYEQVALPPVPAGNSRLDRIAAPGGGEGVVDIAQDVTLWRATLAAGGRLNHATAPDRRLWVQAARGSARVNDEVLTAGDGLAIAHMSAVDFDADSEAELLLFDMGA